MEENLGTAHDVAEALPVEGSPSLPTTQSATDALGSAGGSSLGVEELHVADSTERFLYFMLLRDAQYSTLAKFCVFFRERRRRRLKSHDSTRNLRRWQGNALMRFHRAVSAGAENEKMLQCSICCENLPASQANFLECGHAAHGSRALHHDPEAFDCLFALYAGGDARCPECRAQAGEHRVLSRQGTRRCVGVFDAVAQAERADRRKKDNNDNLAEQTIQDTVAEFEEERDTVSCKHYSLELLKFQRERKKQLDTRTTQAALALEAETMEAELQAILSAGRASHERRKQHLATYASRVWSIQETNRSLPKRLRVGALDGRVMRDVHPYSVFILKWKAAGEGCVRDALVAAGVCYT